MQYSDGYAEPEIMTGALEGLKVADFSWVGAGPRATKDLADNGARVIKIESSKRLDLGRMSPPFRDGKRNVDGSAFFAITNTSKESVTINLGDPRGVEVAKKLIAWADVVVENFGKGFLDRVGLSFADMQAIKPDVILCSVSVAGRTGPHAKFRGYGNSAAAFSGQAALAGWPDRPPHMPPFAYGDVVAPMFATVGILAAVEHRRQTGEGQHVDVSQVEPLAHTLADLFMEHQVIGGDLRRANRTPAAAPHGVFPCTGRENWIAIACETEDQWRALAHLAGLEHEPRFDTLAGRKTHEDDLQGELDAWTIGHEKSELADKLNAAGVPAAPVQNGQEVFEDAELRPAGHYRKIGHSVLGDCEMPAPPMTLSDSDIVVGPPPNLGEHNTAVFVELLGMDEAEVVDLIEQGALA